MADEPIFGSYDRSFLKEQLETIADTMRRATEVPVPEPMPRDSAAEDESNLPATIDKMNELIIAMRGHQRAFDADITSGDGGVGKALEVLAQEIGRVGKITGGEGIIVKQDGAGVNVSVDMPPDNKEIPLPTRPVWGKVTAWNRPIATFDPCENSDGEGCVADVGLKGKLWVANDDAELEGKVLPFVLAQGRDQTTHEYFSVYDTNDVGDIPPIDDFMYGKAYGNWIRGGNVYDTVIVNPCDEDGVLPDLPEGMNHPELEVRLYRHAGCDPNIVGNDVIGIIEDGEIYVCVTDYMDDAIGTVKMWNDYGDRVIPDGWTKCTGGNGLVDMGCGEGDEGLFPRGAASTTTGDVDEDGGNDYHGPEVLDDDEEVVIAENNHIDHLTHDDHTVEYNETDKGYDTGLDIKEVKDVEFDARPNEDDPWIVRKGHAPHNEHSQTDNRPRYRSIIFIERIDNSQ